MKHEPSHNSGASSDPSGQLGLPSHCCQRSKHPLPSGQAAFLPGQVAENENLIKNSEILFSLQSLTLYLKVLTRIHSKRLNNSINMQSLQKFASHGKVLCNKLPSLQASADLAPAPDTLPSGQGVHELEPSKLYVFLPHCLQVEVPSK